MLTRPGVVSACPVCQLGRFSLHRQGTRLRLLLLLLLLSSVSDLSCVLSACSIHKSTVLGCVPIPSPFELQSRAQATHIHLWSRPSLGRAKVRWPIFLGSSLVHPPRQPVGLCIPSLRLDFDSICLHCALLPFSRLLVFHMPKGAFAHHATRRRHIPASTAPLALSSILPKPGGSDAGPTPLPLQPGPIAMLTASSTISDLVSRCSLFTASPTPWPT